MKNMNQRYAIGEAQLYTTGRVTLAAADGSTAQKAIVIDGGGEFVVTQLTGQVIQSNAVVSDWPGQVAIKMTKTNRNWFDEAVGWTALVGSGDLPGILSPERFVPGGLTLTVDFTNRGGTAAIVELVFHGYVRYEV